MLGSFSIKQIIMWGFVFFPTVASMLLFAAPYIRSPKPQRVAFVTFESNHAHIECPFLPMDPSSKDLLTAYKLQDHLLRYFSETYIVEDNREKKWHASGRFYDDEAKRLLENMCVTGPSSWKMFPLL